MDSIPSSELAQCANLLDLITSLVMRSVTNVFTKQNEDFAEITAIYRWAITIKAADHTEKLEGFSRKQISSARDHITTQGLEELSLTLDVADILDKLNMLLLLLETQAGVLASLEQKLTQVKPAAMEDNVGSSHINMGRFKIRGQMHNANSGTSRQVVNLDEADIESLRITNDFKAPISTRVIE
ncbi:hypothetical protein E8E12_010020 [Didymella heteroderae]|uniref:Uncharacterized protein n=1 Tax=Didymella heteroderae TaxID=1769908 RepID=A0A9P4X1H9_9PLEO|nr:hypothetical protein E8E12_010020 [Didymella heteroderae]